MFKDYTRVMFVKPSYGDGVREILALFPDDKMNNGLIGSYAHIGQHSAAHKSFLKRVKAKPCEYAPLVKELEQRGYNLIILNRPDTLKQAFLDLAQDYNAKHDPWGYAMAASFDIAAACYMRGVPCALDYSPGLGGPDIEDGYNRARLMRMNPRKLERLAIFADRLLDILKRAGKDY